MRTGAYVESSVSPFLVGDTVGISVVGADVDAAGVAGVGVAGAGAYFESSIPPLVIGVIV